MTVAVFAEGASRAITVTAGSTELTLLFVFNVFVLLARTRGTVTVGGGIAVAAFTHKHPFNLLTQEQRSLSIFYQFNST